MAVDPVTSNLAPQISGAIQHAARSTGISFEYLLTTAKIESNLNPSAQASTSSAKGLYQFIEQTWLGTVKQDGPALGLGQYADAISQSANGRYEVADPDMRAAIMKLRSDPATSAMMAGAFSRNNAFQLTGMIGRRPTEGELYTAHFLGPDGAGKLINAVESRPGANAAAIFPQAAAANRSIFYDRSGEPRTVSQVYDRLTRHFDNVRTVAVGSASNVAQLPIRAPVPAPKPVPANVPAPATVAPAETTAAAIAATLAPAETAPAAVPDTAGVTRALADAHDALPPVPDTKPLFQAMFTDRARRAVTVTVAGLWTPSVAPAAGAPLASARNGAVRTLDLFTDSATDIRGLFQGKG